MATYFMFGRYTSDALKGISAKRTVEAAELIKKIGGKVNAAYALLGRQDLVLIAEFPDVEHAMKASIGLSKLTGIAFATSPAVTVEEFDKLMA